MGIIKKDQMLVRKQRIEELRPEILALEEEHKGRNKRIAEALNQRNSMNLAGKPWKDSDVSNFKMRYLKEEAATSDTIPDTIATEATVELTRIEADLVEENAAPEPATTTTIPATTAYSLSPDLVATLTTAHESGELEELLTWWQTTKGKAEKPMPIKRPMLKGPEGKINTGLLIDKAIKDRALEAARKDPATTGGSLSLLVELLLWRFLGEPEEFVVNDD